MTRILLVLLALAAPTTAFVALPAPAGSIPSGIARQLPPGYERLSSVTMSVTRPSRIFELVALGRIGENFRSLRGNAHARPLLIFERHGERFILVGRNDFVILRADQGGQCDPFLDSNGSISIKGRFFTVENGVACGQHWTDFVTFRLDDRAGFVFDNERLESWSLNSIDDPDAEALMRDGPQRVRRPKPGNSVRFSHWRRPR